MRNTVLVIFLSFVLWGCAAPHFYENHSFAYNMFEDNPNVYVLDYWYGQNENNTLLRMPASRIKHGSHKQADSSAGLTERGDFLYVKWMDKKTGIIYSEKADLRFSFPKNITDMKVYFIVEENKIVVYLVTREFRGVNEVAVGPSRYRRYINFQIYPN